MGQPAAAPGRRFIAAAVLAALATLAAAAVAALPVFEDISTAGDEIAQTLAPAIAAVACAWASRQVTGRLRLAWILLALSAAVWAAGQAISTVDIVFLHVGLPFPSVADIGPLIAIPLAIAAIRAFWNPPRGTPSRWRVWLDGAIIAFALTFTAWALGLRTIWSDNDPPLEKFFELAYPLGDILIGTVLILALRRATSRQHVRMFLLFGGIAAYSVSDSAFSYLTVSRGSALDASVLDIGWIAGYLLIALAAIAPAARADLVPGAAQDDSPVDLWQLALPWLTVAAAGFSALFLALRGQRLDLFLTALTGVGATLLTINMIFTNRDFLGMLAKSRTSEATLSEVIARAPVGVVRIAPDLRIIEANPRFAELMQVEGSQARRPMRSYFRGPEASRFAARLAALRDGAHATEDDVEARRADGTTFWVHWSATAVQGPNGATQFYVAMFEDTTARHQAAAAAAASLEVLDRLNRLKSEFLQNVSHEFKTALIGIQGFSEFMRDADELDVNDARAFAADIYRDAERLDRMVTEMLALDRMESSRAALRVERVDLDALIRREVDASKQQVHGNTIVLNIEADLPAVAGDEEKLSEVMRTLLENAVKRSPDGGTITLTAVADASGVEVSVKDQGVSARSEFDNRLFGEDDVYANSPIRKVVGTGLGLGIARQVIELHGGRFWLGGSGSEFHFVLPVLWQDRHAAAALSGSPDKPA